MAANFSGAKKGLKSSLTQTKNKPKTYLQKVPLNVSAFILVVIIFAIFGVGALSKENLNEFFNVRVSGLIVFIIFSWTQIWSFKYLGKNYSQEIIVTKDHELITSGPYKFIRHPQYLSQLLSDLGAGVALGGFVAVPLVILLEIPLFVLRAKKEEEIMKQHFGDKFLEYKKQSGFMIPFLG
ncbi:MAG: hypothetical protein A2068_04880 [Ignavibacteria bacterium GWB2_35_6b]|nr:MAG: hypothetical protein A2068_04880 [Ignavibacteria bacterium GWB2_35_6b]